MKRTRTDSDSAEEPAKKIGKPSATSTTICGYTELIFMQREVSPDLKRIRTGVRGVYKMLVHEHCAKVSETVTKLIRLMECLTVKTASYNYPLPPKRDVKAALEHLSTLWEFLVGYTEEFGEAYDLQSGRWNDLLCNCPDFKRLVSEEELSEREWDRLKRAFEREHLQFYLESECASFGSSATADEGGCLFLATPCIRELTLPDLHTWCRVYKTGRHRATPSPDRTTVGEAVALRLEGDPEEPVDPETTVRAPTAVDPEAAVSM